MIDPEFWIFLGVGFLAQLVDGALGMAYGVVCSTVLLAFGVPPAQASASVHVAELFTTAASGVSHAAHKNVDWKLFRRLALPGAAGGCVGAYVLTEVDGDLIRPFVTAYLAFMGLFIVWKALNGRPKPHREPGREATPLAATGGFLDAVGGGGWGPIVTSSLMAGGSPPRQTVGTVNTTEFVVTAAISATFIIALFSGTWEDGKDLEGHAWAVGGLIIGGICAAPLAAWVVKLIPAKRLMLLVGVLIMALAGFQTARQIGWV